MTTNKYFTGQFGIGGSNEQNLVEDNIIEYIQTTGYDFLYIPRDKYVEDPLFQEIPTEKYSDYHILELYIANVTDFGGQGDLFTKFGLEVDDSVDLVCSRKRFTQEVPLTRPRAGDLIYFPLSKHLFEIKSVDDEPGSVSGLNQFYSLSKLYTFKFKCSLYRYSYDDFDTGVAEIDTDLNPDNFLPKGFAAADQIEEEASVSLDWSEDNPFGTTTGS